LYENVYVIYTATFFRKDGAMNNRYSWPVKLLCGGALLLTLAVFSSSPWNSSKADAKSAPGARDALGGVRFQVEVEGRWSGVFTTCSGIGSENELVEYKTAEKGGQANVMKAPGRLRLHDIVLTRPLTSDTKVWSWREEVVVGKVAGARQRCTITMFSPDGKPAAVWELAKAWPINLTEGTEVGGTAVVEQVTITCEGVTRKQ
jgi:phage tail-like protein